MQWTGTPLRSANAFSTAIVGRIAVPPLMQFFGRLGAVMAACSLAGVTSVTTLPW